MIYVARMLIIVFERITMVPSRNNILLIALLISRLCIGSLIDCSGPIYAVNTKMTDSFYTTPMIRFLSNNLFMVSWSQNRTAVTQQYRFYTISPYDNEIDTVLDDQYTDDRFLNIWYNNHSNLTGY
eukprot:323874_1